MLFLLQADTVNVPVEAGEGLSLFSLLLKGGWVMIPIFLLSFIAVYILIERFLYIKNNSRIDEGVVRKFQQSLRQADVSNALASLRTSSDVYSRIFQHAMARLGRPARDIESQIESAANIEISAMHKNMNYLGIIAGIAPMLGFIGTISGIIRIFYNISVTDNISIGTISEGLYEKMITSAAGLIVGIFAYTAYHFLNGMIDNFANRIERESFDFMNIIHQPAK
ncbi:MAG: MotA/TolQ/ExbB proton channel family protein [Chitinophagales bacterium]|nr:MotA/TolQ/ExbB proton channel family protein [Chitinophagales bacterium]